MDAKSFTISPTGQTSVYVTGGNYSNTTINIKDSTMNTTILFKYNDFGYNASGAIIGSTNNTKVSLLSTGIHGSLTFEQCTQYSLMLGFFGLFEKTNVSFVSISSFSSVT